MAAVGDNGLRHAGRPRRYGIHAPDIDASVCLCQDLLGFRVSDFTTIATPA